MKATLGIRLGSTESTVIRIDGLGLVLEDDHQHALVYGGVEPPALWSLNPAYLATLTFPA